MPIAEEKKRLRAKCLADRLAVTGEAKARADEAIFRTVSAHSAFLEADLVLLYFPVRGEIDLTPLCAAANQLGIPVAFPRCEGKDLIFHTVKSCEELLPDRFDIPAPAATAPIAKITKRTLCILPGLAAGRDKTRLGYGGGFYDRFLSTFRGITLYPVYESLLFSTLPTEATDRTVDHLITEKGEIA